MIVLFGASLALSDLLAWELEPAISTNSLCINSTSGTPNIYISIFAEQKKKQELKYKVQNWNIDTWKHTLALSPEAPPEK